MIAFERFVLCAVLMWLCLLSPPADARARFRTVPAYVKSLLDDGAEVVDCSVVTTQRAQVNCDEIQRVKVAAGAFVFGFVRARGPEASEESIFAFILRASLDGSMSPVARSAINAGGRLAVFEFAKVDAPSNIDFRIHLIAGGRASEPSSYDYTISRRNGQWVVARAEVFRIRRCSEEAFAETEYQVDYLTGRLRWSHYEDCEPAPVRERSIPPRVMPLASFMLIRSDDDIEKYMEAD